MSIYRNLPEYIKDIILSYYWIWKYNDVITEMNDMIKDINSINKYMNTYGINNTICGIQHKVDKLYRHYCKLHNEKIKKINAYKSLKYFTMSVNNYTIKCINQTKQIQEFIDMNIPFYNDITKYYIIYGNNETYVNNKIINYFKELSDI
tara:strand:- start:5426 stop:5872 length:447 start_codon:yes stop_codon:yes gene_type:complete